MKLVIVINNFSKHLDPWNKALTFLIQPSNDIVYVVGEKSSAVQDCGQHCCNGSTGHRLIV